MIQSTFQQELTICRIVIASLTANLKSLADEYDVDTTDPTAFAIRRQEVSLKICTEEFARIDDDTVDIEFAKNPIAPVKLMADITALRFLLAEISDTADTLKESVDGMKWQVEVRRSASL